jgi:predicted DNA-binding transcriptional regulator AlpA
MSASTSQRVQRRHNIQLIDTPELSALTGIPTSTLENYRTQKDKGPRFMKLGRRVMYDIKDVEAWLNGRKRS